MKVPRKIHQFAACAAILLLFSAPALAQRGKWWQDERFGHELGLTAEQRTHLEEIFQKTLPTLRAKMKELDDAQALFDRLVEKATTTRSCSRSRPSRRRAPKSARRGR